MNRQTTPLQARTLKGLVLILLPLSFSFAVALDIYIPIVPQMVAIFHTTPQLVQLTLSLFMFTMGLGQLCLGPLSDQIGRRRALLLSVSLYIIGSLTCAFSVSIGMLIIGRVIQAAGGCGALAAGNAIVRDIHVGQQAGQVYSYLNGSIALSPLFAPLLGSYLTHWFNWRAPFLFLSLFGVFAAWLTFTKINETQDPKHRRRLSLQLFKHYISILRHPEFRQYIICVGVSVSCFFTFFCISPYILIQRLHINPIHFGYFFGIFGLLFFLSSLLSAYLCKYFSIFRICFTGIILVTLSGMLMLLWFYIGGLSLLGFLVPMAVISIGGSLAMGAGAAGALAPFGTMAGTASAMLGCLQFLIAAIIGTLATWHVVHNTLPLAYVALIGGVIGSMSCGLSKLTHR